MLPYLHAKQWKVMATAHAPFLLKGKILNLVFRVRDGKQIVQAAPREPTRHKHGPAYTLNKDEFAAAAMIAQSVYRHIRHDVFDQRKPHTNHHKLGPIFRPYAQNHLTARLKLKADLEGKRRHKSGYHYATQFRFIDAVNALKGFDLSNPGSPSGFVGMIPIGPQHSPTAIKVMGLQDAAQAIARHGNARMELRFHIRQSRVMELNYDRDTRAWDEPQGQSRPVCAQNKSHCSKPTDWIPAEIIPSQGFTLPLPQGIWAEDEKYLTAVMVEWREVRTIGRRTVRLHKQGIVRIAALHAPVEAWARPEAHPQDPQPPKPRPPRRQAPRIDPLQEPEAYIRQALAKLHPE